MTGFGDDVDLGDLTRPRRRRLGHKPGANTPKPLSILEYAARKAAENSELRRN